LTGGRVPNSSKKKKKKKRDYGKSFLHLKEKRWWGRSSPAKYLDFREKAGN